MKTCLACDEGYELVECTCFEIMEEKPMKIWLIHDKWGEEVISAWDSEEAARAEEERLYPNSAPSGLQVIELNKPYETL